MVEDHGPNAHVHEYLDYYTNTEEALGFAVLLDGPWGVGKTFLIKQYFDCDEGDEPTHVYLSLYGIASEAELQRALVAAFYPIVKDRTTELASSIAKSALSFFNIDTDLKPEDFLKIPKEKVIVIDDLERCVIPIHIVLGQLNPLIEHDGHKLILLGNQNEIPPEQRELYQKKREKVIGQILSVKSDINGAYEFFLSKLRTDDSRKYLLKRRKAVLSIYEQSGVENLRALQQALWLFERVFDSLSKKYRCNEDAMLEILQLLVVFALEHQTGGITASDLSKRSIGLAYAVRQLNAERNEDETRSKSNITKADKKYVDVNLRSEILSNELLLDVVTNGRVNKQSIEDELLQSHYFNDLLPEEPWRAVWHGLERSESDFEAAKDKMLKAFENREFRTPGLILHVTALRLWLGEIGYIAKSRDQLTTEAISYIDDIYEMGAFDCQEPGKAWRPADVASNGLGFFEKETSEFGQIVSHIEKRMSEAYKNQRGIWAQDLLDTLQVDPSEFLQQICFTNHGTNRFLKEPVLHKLEPDAYIDAALQLNPKDQKIAFAALRSRYENRELESILAEEKDWFLALRSGLAARAANTSKITRHKLELFDVWFFKPILDEASAKR
ncbi:MAG: P-loop NTPase fold protein [Pseudomonadota bacterium]